ncbi:MAG: hypothetical protein V2I33_23005 [Kangiellaceae bacterium]|nr:hypothetical protein [Kangiellaceae bacterium]
MKSDNVKLEFSCGRTGPTWTIDNTAYFSSFYSDELQFFNLDAIN